MTTLAVNGLTATSVRLFQPWSGAWVADADFDLETVPMVPVGPAILKVGTAVLLGTVDPDASGKFGEKARARIIGGGGGWHRTVSARHFHNDVGVFSAAVIAATAAEVGEKAVDASPSRLGVDYMRSAGPASRVLAGRDWYVELTSGTTIVGPRATLPANPLTVEVLDWDPEQQRAEIASDDIVSPGTVLVDTRFGTATIRDVEQTFSAGGARATAWCSEKASTRLVGLLSSLVGERGRTLYLKPHHYRIVAQGPDGRLTLQAVRKTSGVPDSIALPIWYGAPGLKSELVTPGTECAVVFLDGDPAQPAVVSFYGGNELATGIATQATQAAFVSAVVTFAGALQAFFNFPGVAAISGGTAQPAAAAAAALATTAALPTNYSLRTKAV